MPGQGLPKFTSSKESNFLWLAAAKSCTTENLIEVGQNTALYFFGTPHDVNSMQKGFEFQVESWKTDVACIRKEFSWAEQDQICIWVILSLGSCRCCRQFGKIVFGDNFPGTSRRESRPSRRRSQQSSASALALGQVSVGQLSQGTMFRMLSSYPKNLNKLQAKSRLIFGRFLFQSMELNQQLVASYKWIIRLPRKFWSTGFTPCSATTAGCSHRVLPVVGCRLQCWSNSWRSQ